MRNFSCYVSNEFGIHARPSALLATVHKHFFQSDDILVVNVTSGHEAPINDIMRIMLMAAGYGTHIEFVTMLSHEAFEDFREIIFLLAYERTRPHAYDLTCLEVARCRGDRKGLIEALTKVSVQRKLHPIFSTDPVISVAPSPPGNVEFRFEKEVLDLLYSFEPLAYEDALKAGALFERCDSTALVVMRRLCERIVNRLSNQTNDPKFKERNLASKIEVLSDIGVLQVIDRHCLSLFRFLGNAGVHDSRVPDSDLIPDRDAAFYLYKLCENLVRRILLREQEPEWRPYIK